MAMWPRGTLDVIPNAEHEVLMEAGPVRQRIFDMLVAHFQGAYNNGVQQRSA
jgi:lysophospholipase